MAEQLSIELTEQEEWRTVDVRPDYQVSSLGRIRRVGGKLRSRKGDILKGSTKPDGYITLRLQGSTYRLNILVCRAFHGPAPADKPFAAHWDGNKSNNSIDNLRWASKPENEADKLRHGRDNRGERHGMSKLTADQVRQIRQRFDGGERCPTIAPDFEISPRQVLDIGKRINWGWLE